MYPYICVCVRTIELQEEHHEAIVPALLGCIDPANGGCPRVLHRALLTLAMVVEACPQGGVMPHAEELLERFVFFVLRSLVWLVWFVWLLRFGLIRLVGWLRGLRGWVGWLFFGFCVLALLTLRACFASWLC